MNFYIIYTASELLLSKKQYKTWREIQDEYPAYKASLGPWGIVETEEYLKDEYPKIHPSAFAQLDGLVKSADLVHIVTFA